MLEMYSIWSLYAAFIQHANLAEKQLEIPTSNHKMVLSGENHVPPNFRQTEESQYNAVHLFRLKKNCKYKVFN